jgi:hypothetical protein
LTVIATRLAERFDERPSAEIARELRTIVTYLVDDYGNAPGVLARLQASRHARRVDYLLAEREPEAG